MVLPPNFTLRSPQTKEDFEKYYSVRYETLRKPWGQPAGSEVDPTDQDAFHAFILDQDNAVAVCRLHFNNHSEGQIRYMGVLEPYRGKGLGAIMVSYFENLAKEKGATRMILHARDNAVSFYRKSGYTIKEKSYLLFDKIQHYLMTKNI